MVAGIAWLDPDLIVAGSAVLVSVLVSLSQLQTRIQASRRRKVAESLAKVHAEVDRDVEIVQGAKLAVEIMKSALEEAFAEVARLRRENEALRAGGRDTHA